MQRQDFVSSIVRPGKIYGIRDWEEGKFVPVFSNKKRYYGGYQDWLENEGISSFFSNRACGVTAAANMLAYMAMQVPEKASLYTKNSMHISDFSLFQKELYAYLSPKIWGIPTLKAMIQGVKAFALDQGIGLEAVYSKKPWTEENVEKYMLEGFEKNAPVLLLTWRTHVQDLSMHWVTVTALHEENGEKEMIVSNWGRQKTYDFFSWVKNTKNYRGLVYFE